MGQGHKIRQGIFISGTDTGVGKTIAICVLGTLLQDRGLDIGVMKPVQCGGGDAAFLRKSLSIKDSLDEINPYRAKEPFSPHIAFKRQRTVIDIERIKDAYHNLKDRHDLLLVEGAGGLLAPIKNNYLVADLIKDLDLELIIISRLNLGTINHTLLTIHQARERGIRIKGVIFNEVQKTRRGIPEKTNPQAIRSLGKVAVLGTVPYLNPLNAQKILKKCKARFDLKPLLNHRSSQKTTQLIEWDKKYLWHPFTQMQDWLKEQPLIIDEARGCYLRDTQGKLYLDGVSSLWVIAHGHGHILFKKALKDQIDKLSHSTLLGLSHTPAIQLAKKLVAIAPAGLTKVFYSDNGATSVEIAVKMAYQYWQNIGKKNKTRIAHLNHSYHGDTLGSVSVGGIDLFHKVYSNLTFKTVKIPFPDGYRAPRAKTSPQYLQECMNKLERLFRERHGSIAALIVEPIVQGAAGMIVWPQGILKKMKALCKKYDIFLIADEVATGFGRTGRMFACDHENVSPDILCLAKGLTGGYLPLAATLTTQRVFDGFLFDYKEQKAFFHGHTYTGNPLGCAAALANLKVFEKEQTLRRLQPKIKFLRDKLRMFYHLRHVGDVRQKGFMVGIELVKDKKSKVPYLWEEKIGAKVCQEVRKNGVILRPLGNVIVIMPPLSISIQELKKLLDVTCEAIKTVT